MDSKMQGRKLSTIEKSREAWEAGLRWRAKEILQGSIRSCGFNPEIYEEYGRVLLGMGDTLEAGKYLFLSGVRLEEYAEPIKLYLSRYAKTEPTQLYASFPTTARKLGFGRLPDTVQLELRALGLTEAKLQRFNEYPEPTFSDKVFNYFLLAVLLSLLGFLVLGLVTAVRFVFVLFS